TYCQYPLLEFTNFLCSGFLRQYDNDLATLLQRICFNFFLYPRFHRVVLGHNRTVLAEVLEERLDQLVLWILGRYFTDSFHGCCGFFERTDDAAIASDGNGKSRQGNNLTNQVQFFRSK